MTPVVRFVRRHPRLLKWARFAQWRVHILRDWLSTHVLTRPSRVRTPFGFELSAGAYLANRMMQSGEFEQRETEILRERLRDADVFIDVGANIGYYTCIARAAGVHVIAFEPQARNLQLLLDNLRRNGWDDVEVFPIGLGERAALLELFGSSGPSASMIQNWASYPSGYRQLIPINRLDDVLGQRLAGQRALVKIDVEGFEHSVLAGATGLLDLEPKPTWIMEICLDEFHPDGLNPHYLETFDLFFDRGYRVFAIDAATTPVSREDVRRWHSRGKSSLGVFNYLITP